MSSSSRFSLGSTTPSEAAASEPLLSSRTPATVPRPPPRPFLSLFGFGSPAGSPASSAAVPLDTTGFDKFDTNVTQKIQWEITNPIIEKQIVSIVASSQSDPNPPDPSIIFNTLKREGFIGFFPPGTTEKQQKRLVLAILDQIIFYRKGCSKVQMGEISSNLRSYEKIADEENKKRANQSFIDKFKETSEEKTTREQIKQQRERTIDLLKRRIAYCDALEPELMANSLVSKFDANDMRECAFVRYCRERYGEENNFCGTATVSNDSPLVSSAIVDVAPSHDIKFEVIIAGDGVDSLTTSVSLTGLCTPVSPGGHQYVMFEQAFNEDVARRIKDDVKNALFNDFKDVDPLEKADVPSNARITLFVQKKCNTAGQRDVIVTSENDLNPSCCSSSCSLQGGAKKIKRTRQSKKKKVRRSKSKSKRVRRKNKSRRN